jgi:hypothetical protein
MGHRNFNISSLAEDRDASRSAKIVAARPIGATYPQKKRAGPHLSRRGTIGMA